MWLLTMLAGAIAPSDARMQQERFIEPERAQFNAIPFTVVALGVSTCVSTLWLRFRKQKICVVHRSQSNQAITTEMRLSFQQIQSGEDKLPECSPYTLRFRTPDLEEEFLYHSQLSSLARTQRTLLGMAALTVFYMILYPSELSTALQLAPAIVSLLVASALASQERFESSEMFAAGIFLVAVLVDCLSLLWVSTEPVARVTDHGAATSPSALLLMVYLAAIMFGTGHIWITKTAASVVVQVVYVVFLFRSVLGRNVADAESRQAQADAMATAARFALFTTAQMVLIACAGYSVERRLRAEFARKWALLSEKRTLKARLEKLRRRSIQLANGVQLTGPREVEFKSPLQRAIATLTTIRSAVSDRQLLTALDVVIKALNSTDDLRGIDLSSHINLDMDAGDLDHNIGQWLRDMYQPKTRKTSVRNLHNNNTPSERVVNGSTASTPSSRADSPQVVSGQAAMESLTAAPTRSAQDTLTPGRPPRRGRHDVTPAYLTREKSYRFPEVNQNDVIMYLENKAYDWDFDIFHFGTLAKGKPLVFIASKFFDAYHIVTEFKIPVDILRQFVVAVNDYYKYDEETDNSYHTSLHAADVMQTVACLLSEPNISCKLDPLKVFAALFAAMMHDFRHKGVTNAFLINTNDELSIIHNDSSVLERFHASETFKMLRTPKYNIICNMQEDDKKYFRQSVIDMILATDLKQGPAYCTSFQQKMDSGCAFEEDEDVKLLLQLVLKCADVSHAAKPLRLHKIWTVLITEEFFRQGDKEKQLGLPVSPLCDRETCTDIASQQRGYIQFVVSPTFKPLAKYCNNSSWMETIEANARYWSERSQQPNKDLPSLQEEVGLSATAKRR